MDRNSYQLLVITVVCLLAAVHATGLQKINRVEQEQARAMLHQVEEAIEKNYFDPNFHGYNLQSRFEAAEKRLSDVPNLVAALGVIGWAVEGLNDSHTFFRPPARNVVVYSGWQMDMVGENCLITAVDPSSDAWKKGLRPGDQLIKVESYEPTASTFRIIQQRLEDLLPLAEYHLVVTRPGQAASEITTKSQLVTISLTLFSSGDTQHQVDRMLEGYRFVNKTRMVEINDKLMIWKLPQFNLKQSEIEHLIGSARKHETLILDLRDNSGGGEDQLRWMIGNFFDHDITVGEMVERKGSEPLRISSRGNKGFGGKLLVLSTVRRRPPQKFLRALRSLKNAVQSLGTTRQDR
jgi:C-terminal processing protease CtpA/Prc